MIGAYAGPHTDAVDISTEASHSRIPVDCASLKLPCFNQVKKIDPGRFYLAR